MSFVRVLCQYHRLTTHTWNHVVVDGHVYFRRMDSYFASIAVNDIVTTFPYHTIEAVQPQLTEEMTAGVDFTSYDTIYTCKTRAGIVYLVHPADNHLLHHSSAAEVPRLLRDLLDVLLDHPRVGLRVRAETDALEKSNGQE